MKRREVLKLTAAAAATPLLPGASSAEAAPLAAGRFFTAAEMTLLDELTEMIIPQDEHSGGVRAAKVAAYIDGRLADYDPTIPPLREEREKWKAGLAVIDTLARAANGKPFLQASAAQRTALLERLAAGDQHAELPTEQPPDRGKPAEEKPETLGQRFFEELKSWTARGYYTSKIGLHDDIGYKGNTLQAEFAGIDVATLPPIKPQD